MASKRIFGRMLVVLVVCMFAVADCGCSGSSGSSSNSSSQSSTSGAASLQDSPYLGNWNIVVSYAIDKNNNPASGIVVATGTVSATESTLTMDVNATGTTDHFTADFLQVNDQGYLQYTDGSTVFTLGSDKFDKTYGVLAATMENGSTIAFVVENGTPPSTEDCSAFVGDWVIDRVASEGGSTPASELGVSQTLRITPGGFAVTTTGDNVVFDRYMVMGGALVILDAKSGDALHFSITDTGELMNYADGTILFYRRA